MRQATVTERATAASPPPTPGRRQRVGVAQAVTAPLPAHDGLVYVVADPIDPDESSVLFAVR